MARKTLAAAATGAVLAVLTACASPGSSAPSESAEASMPASQSADPSAGESASAEATTPGDESPSSDPTATDPAATESAAPSTGTGPAPQAGAESWPPKLVLSEILEAGTTQVSLGKVTLTLPAGFADAGDGSYTSNWPSASGPATITISQAPTDGTASDALAAHATWARNAPVNIPNATSAAMADAVVGGAQTWGLAIVDSSGTATIVTFEAASQDFQDYLIYQSVSSVVVAA